MSNLTAFIWNFRAQGGFKGKLKNKLFAPMLGGFEAVDTDLGAILDELSELRRRTDELAAETARCSGVVYSFDSRIGGTSELAEALRRDLENVGANLRGNNASIEKLSADCELLKLKLSRIEKNGITAQSGAPVQAASAAQQPAENSSDYDCIDYFDFENRFRGSIDSIKKAQEIYLPYFEGKKSVLDIGCGRGEFLSLMKDNGISAKGVDIYEPYVDYCNMNGFSAVCGDGAQYLSQCGEVDGIFLGQVVEHLKTGQIMQICNAAYEKLPEGGCIVIETPNPTSLAIYTNAFYIDPSHVKPVHPLTMRYFLEKAGFTDIRVIFTEGSRPPQRIPSLDIENAEEFNSAMSALSDILYGSQDYAVIAVK